MSRYVQVLLDRALDRYFDYSIPPHLAGQLRPGDRIVVPLKTTEQHGYVIRLTEHTSYEASVRDVIRLDERLIPLSLLQLAHWLHAYYCAPLVVTLRAMLPAPVRKKNVKEKSERVLSFSTNVDPLAEIAKRQKKAPKQALVLQKLLKAKEATPSFLAHSCSVSPGVIQSLIKSEESCIEVKERNVERDPFAGIEIMPSNALTLTDEQEVCYEAICTQLEKKVGATFLLYGVTGSGKTEVYLQSIQRCIEQGRQAIVLVPEIALTPQTVGRFRARFGDCVSVLHSNLNEGERYEQWRKIHGGECSIVVGARSALFAPFDKLGLIVVDEEHEASYKQDSQPRYHARDLAVVRAMREKAICILGSATPSFESFHNTKVGKYQLLKLTKRAESATMPEIQVVDMRIEAAATGQTQIFSRLLIEAVKERIEANMQSILFLNRRGYSPSFSCSKCGYVAKCPHCDISYTYHKRSQALSCHLCTRTHVAEPSCPECKNDEMESPGMGTQKIEALCKVHFPEARILRMDSDTMTRKNSHQVALDAFHAGRYDILIGTQMIAKGLHFPRVTLAAIIFADMSLNMQDFRAAERTFQLITQVAGRSGREAHKGEVLIQTYAPEHPALTCALKGSFDDFYENEIIGREICKFPPYRHMAVIHFIGKNLENCEKSAKFVHEKIIAEAVPDCDIMPPVPSPLPKIDDQYRFQITIFTDKVSQLSRSLGPLLKGITVPRGIRFYADIDPQSFS